MSNLALHTTKIIEYSEKWCQSPKRTSKGLLECENRI